MVKKAVPFTAAVVAILFVGLTFCDRAEEVPGTLAGENDPVRPSDNAKLRPKPFSQLQEEGRELVLTMFDRSLSLYLDHAFPKDELRPLSCSGIDNFGGFGITAIDALDTMAVLGFHDDFREKALWACERLQDVAAMDVEVSVFETVIRAVGGLLGAHFAYEHGLVTVDPGVHQYDGCLLARAAELADRLLPAFKTKTGIPYGTINLKRGIKKGEVQSTSTACGGTLLLEFHILSAVTGDPTYERVARTAAVELFKHRHGQTNTVGSHINITTGHWDMPEVLLGVSVDSYLEYLLKAFVLTGDEVYQGMFETLRRGFRDNVMRGPGHGIEVKHDGTVQRPIHNSLSNFYSTLLTLNGNLAEAEAMVRFQHSLFSRYGALPEGFDIFGLQPPDGQTAAPLRPEHAESLYYLYRATGDGKYVKMAYEYAVALETNHRVECGYAALKDVTVPADAVLQHHLKSAAEQRRNTPPKRKSRYVGKTLEEDIADRAKRERREALLSHRYEDRQDSYFLSETLKYLFLIFDEHNALHGAAAYTAETDADRTTVIEATKELNAWASGGGGADPAGDEGTCGGGVAASGPSAPEIAERVAAEAARFEDAARGAQAARMKPQAPSSSAAGALPWLFNTEGHLLPVTAEWSTYSRHARRRDDDRHPLGPVRNPAQHGFPVIDKLPYV